MSRNMWMLAVPVRWKVLEEFYAGVEGGPEKLEAMKRHCDDDVFSSWGGRRWRFAEVNREYLVDRRRRLNAEFDWGGENILKLIELDKRLRELEQEIGENFARIKLDLDDLVGQGGKIYRGYQVEAQIDYDPEDGGEKGMPGDDWTRSLLRRYLDGQSLDWFTFGEGQEPDEGESVVEPWGKWTQDLHFMTHGVTRYLCHLLEERNGSLYSFADVAAMDPKSFRVSYDVLL